ASLPVAGRAVEAWSSSAARDPAVGRHITAWFRPEDLARGEPDAPQALDLRRLEQAERAPRLPGLLGPQAARQRALGIADFYVGAAVLEPDPGDLHIGRRAIRHVEEDLRAGDASLYACVNAYDDALAVPDPVVEVLQPERRGT